MFRFSNQIEGISHPTGAVKASLTMMKEKKEFDIINERTGAIAGVMVIEDV